VAATSLVLWAAKMNSTPGGIVTVRAGYVCLTGEAAEPGQEIRPVGMLRLCPFLCRRCHTDSPHGERS
ncbi:MAG TPA: hypothetical protein VJA25_01725, partial [Dehalococcoidia bacterium]|nr:hypothetical protein [Dehalococcoidia bacterium]